MIGIYKQINNRISLRFSNKLRVSIIFGYGTYTDTHEDTTNDKKSKFVEVAIMDGNQDDKWITKPFYKKYYNKDISDDVQGWVSVDNLADLLKDVKDCKEVL